MIVSLSICSADSFQIGSWICECPSPFLCKRSRQYSFVQLGFLFLQVWSNFTHAEYRAKSVSKQTFSLISMCHSPPPPQWHLKGNKLGTGETLKVALTKPEHLLYHIPVSVSEFSITSIESGHFILFAVNQVLSVTGTASSVTVFL